MKHQSISWEFSQKLGQTIIHFLMFCPSLGQNDCYRLLGDDFGVTTFLQQWEWFLSYPL